MKRSSTIFLQIVIVLIGIVALFLMIRFPLTEGRAVNLDLFSIYADPFIVYGYLASIPFFVALYQAFKLLGYIRQNKVFSLSSVKTLRTIKYCAIALSILIVIAAIYIRISFSVKSISSSLNIFFSIEIKKDIVKRCLNVSLNSWIFR